MPFFKNILTLFFFGLALVGCAQIVERTKPSPKTLALQRAQAYMDHGNFQAAADIFQQLSRKSVSPERESFQMRAISALMSAENNIAAKQVADQVDPDNLTELQRSQLFLFFGRIAQEGGNPQQALNYLQRVKVDQFNDEFKLLYYEYRAAAFSNMGNILESVKSRVKAGIYLEDRVEIEKNNSAIIAALNLLPKESLIALRPPPSDTLRGWVALVQILKRGSASQLGIAQQLVLWRRDFPRHPASESFIQAYLSEQNQKEFSPPTNIAILLPYSGPYAVLAKTIREGILAAYYDQQEGLSPSIHFYDTQLGNLYSTYQQAVANGADFVIGPLTKDNLQNLVQSGELTVPVLALNRLRDSVNQPKFIEFGLSPEDETEQAASSAWFDGHQKALVFAPSTNFGRRLAAHFSRYWQDLGGEVLDVQTYAPKESDFSVPIKQLLGLDESEQRYNRLKKYVWDAKFEPRRRHDADFIFLVAQPREARLIRPQFQYFRASHVPIYATSHVFSGQINPSLDRDLSDIIFCDIPWLFDEAGQDALANLSLEELRRQTPGVHLRLVALGADSFNVLSHLNRLRRDPTARYNGLTGALSVNQENRIQRQLQCAKFENGIPMLRGLAPHLQIRDENERSNLFSDESTVGTGVIKSIPSR